VTGQVKVQLFSNKIMYNCSAVVKVFPCVKIGTITDMRVSYDGQLCCTISDDKSMKIFDVENFGKQIFIVLVLVT
jgi:hypothetical protein